MYDEILLPQVISCKAAIAWAPKQPLSIETIEVAPPQKGEVRIKITASGVCHTDAYTLGGFDSEGVFPVVLGHEGAGIVESIGEDVKDFAVGDHVIPLYIPQCKSCKFCESPKTNLCSRIRETQGRGVLPDGTTRFTCKGQQVYHFMGTSTFAEYTVVAAISLAKVSTFYPNYLFIMVFYQFFIIINRLNRSMRRLHLIRFAYWAAVFLLAMALFLTQPRYAK